MTQTKLAVMLLEALRQQKEEHIEGLNALLKSVSSRDSMGQVESAKLEAEIDALESYEKQRFNEAMAKAKAQGLILH